MKQRKITGYMEVFCQTMVKGVTQLEAYRTAYPAANMSDRTAAKRASELFKRPEIKARIAELAKIVETEFAVQNSDLIKEAARLAFLDPRKLFNEDGSVKSPAELDEDTAKAIASMEVVRTTNEDGEVTTTYKYKFWDKNSAMERLFKFKGMFMDNNKQVGDSFAEALYKLTQGTKPPIKK